VVDLVQGEKQSQVLCTGRSKGRYLGYPEALGDSEEVVRHWNIVFELYSPDGSCAGKMRTPFCRDGRDVQALSLVFDISTILKMRSQSRSLAWNWTRLKMALSTPRLLDVNSSRIHQRIFGIL
jgi:hypothetical protein